MSKIALLTFRTTHSGKCRSIAKAELSDSNATCDMHLCVSKDDCRVRSKNQVDVTIIELLRYKGFCKCDTGM